jgi:hypothetical protein
LCRDRLLVASHLHRRGPDAPVFSNLPAAYRILQLNVSFDAKQLNFESAISDSPGIECGWLQRRWRRTYVRLIVFN